MNAHAQEWIDAYFDGALPADQRQQAERHLAGCEACRKLLDERRSLSALLQEAPPAAPVKSERELIAGLALRLEKQPAPPSPFAQLAWLVIPIGLLLAWSFIQAVMAAGSLAGLVPGLGPLLLGFFSQPIFLLPAFSDAIPALGWLGTFEFIDWPRLIAFIGMLVVGLMYAGWMAAWWSHHHPGLDRQGMERNTNL